MILKRIYATAAVPVCLLPFILFFREPATTIRSGDELCALSWVIADELGSGSWEFYPVIFSISFEEGRTISRIDGCGTTFPPGRALPSGIPAPVDYSQTGNTVTISFNEVPDNAYTP